MALIHDVAFDSGTRVLSLLDKAGNVISSCEVPRKSEGNELKLTATADNSRVELRKHGTLSNTYEVNTGSGWTAYTFGTSIPLNAGQSCKWRCSAHPTTQYRSNYVKFVMMGQIEASGNCNSMLSSDFENITSLTGYNYAFASLFQGCTSLTRAPELPATTLSESCYYKMFYECTNLVQAPELPALSIPDSFLAGRDGAEVFGCYVSMFEGCTSLVQAPALPATTLGKGCYVRMFYGCRSLVQAPELPATTLPDVLNDGGTSVPAFGCYSDMFGVCTSLVQSPSLPATTLGGACYGYMFYGCTSLVQAPALPATTLTFYCYAGMFQGCSSLNEIRVSATDISADRCTLGWVQNVSSTGDFYCNPDTAWTTGFNGIPTGWNRVNEGAPSVDDPNKPLMLRAIEDNSSVTLTKVGTSSNTYQTSTNGTDWTDYTLGTKISLNNGKSVYFRCSHHPTNQADSNYVDQADTNYVMFTMEGKIEAWHNAYSMISSSFTNTGASVGSFGMYCLFKNCKSLTKAPLLVNTLAEHCYRSMFYGCTGLTQAPELPVTTLTKWCYFGMFEGCTSLTQAPALPATTLAQSCYSNMFYGCTGLTQAPELPVTTLAIACYGGMFRGCTSLTQAPALPATTLTKMCYNNMFHSCTSLTQAPSLPATTLADSCYTGMFYGCTSLTQAPALPSTTLVDYCYNQMFVGCTSLTQAPALPATTLTERCYFMMFNGCTSLNEVRISATRWSGINPGINPLDDWLKGVSATGDFYCDPNATIFPKDSVNGIPTGWTRHALSDYPQT